MFGTIVLSLVAYVIFIFVAEPLGFYTEAGSAADVSTILTTYLFLPLSTAACLLPDFAINYWFIRTRPSDEEILREERYVVREKKLQ